MDSDRPGVIMVGVDGTPTSMRAAAFAAGLARRQDAHLVVVFVAEPSAWLPIGLPGLVYAQRETLDALAADLRRQTRRGAEDLGVPMIFLYRHGDPYLQLCQAADEVRADMVVVGASAGLCHRVARSTGSRLMRTRRWPVVVVP
jgi:nucleotide-binding universal stress UspA family protein